MEAFLKVRDPCSKEATSKGKQGETWDAVKLSSSCSVYPKSYTFRIQASGCTWRVYGNKVLLARKHLEVQGQLARRFELDFFTDV